MQLERGCSLAGKRSIIIDMKATAVSDWMPPEMEPRKKGRLVRQ